MIKLVHSASVTVQDLNKLTEQLYPENFSGLGELEQPYDIKLDRDVAATIQAPHKIPCAKRDKMKTALDKMTQSGVIADANGPTDWVSNLVITEKKSGALRNYLDSKPLNPVIKREHLNRTGRSTNQAGR